MTRSAAWLILYLAVAVGSCVAASPWDGTWVFNPVRSHLKPGEIKIERRGNGYQWDGPFAYYASCNGVPSPGPDGFLIRCTERPEEVRTTLLEHGRPFSVTVYRVEPGGKKLQVTTEYMHGRQPHTLQVDDYVRKSGAGIGLEGSWQGVATAVRGPSTFVLRLRHEEFYYLDTMEGAVTTAKLDGSPALFGDPHPDNVRWVNRWDGPRRIFGAYLVDGRPHLRRSSSYRPTGGPLRPGLLVMKTMCPCWTSTERRPSRSVEGKAEVSGIVRWRG